MLQASKAVTPSDWEALGKTLEHFQRVVAEATMAEVRALDVDLARAVRLVTRALEAGEVPRSRKQLEGANVDLARAARQVTRAVETLVEAKAKVTADKTPTTARHCPPGSSPPAALSSEGSGTWTTAARGGWLSTSP